MQLKKYGVFLLATLFMVAACRKEEKLPPLENIPGFGGDQWVKTAIDNWIYDTLTLPYNISVKYKWDQGELPGDFNKTLVPPKEEQVIPLLSAINRAWIQPYITEAGLPFFRDLAPKFFVLVGSGAYQSGAIKLGEAEGGRKVTLFTVNEFRVRGMPGYVLPDTTNVLRTFKTIQHEFAHILDQNVQVPISFSASSASSYTSDWLNVTASEARNEGFITPYANSSKGEDFAEMVSIMLVYGKPYFDSYVNSITYTGTTPNGTTAVQAKARLKEKEAAVVAYYKQAWNIDFYNLQSRIRGAITSLF
jgi:substrate import-associated zinc metallohydrolase lipoprotein